MKTAALCIHPIIIDTKVNVILELGKCVLTKPKARISSWIPEHHSEVTLDITRPSQMPLTSCHN